MEICDLYGSLEGNDHVMEVRNRISLTCFVLNHCIHLPSIPIMADRPFINQYIALYTYLYIYGSSYTGNPLRHYQIQYVSRRLEIQFTIMKHNM